MKLNEKFLATVPLNENRRQFVEIESTDDLSLFMTIDIFFTDPENGSCSIASGVRTFVC